jgi:TonB family protein
MKLRIIFLTAFAFFLFSQNSFSQRPVFSPRPVMQTESAPEFYRVGEITGNIGGAKALYLAKPVYAVQARESGADGKVKVEIEIGEDGSVTSAKAVSGEPALFDAAQNAALASRFSVPKVDGRGTKVSGSLNYDFIIETPNWFKVGYDVALIGKAPSLAYFQTAVIKKVIQPDWKTELDSLAQLQEIRRAEKKELADMPDEPVRSGTIGRTSGSQTLQMRLPIPTQNPQKIVIAQNLFPALQARLAGDAANLWQLNLGAAFIKVQEVYRNPATRGSAGEVLKPYLDNAPGGVSTEIIEQLKKLVEAFENNSSGDIRNEIGKAIAALQKIK